MSNILLTDALSDSSYGIEITNHPLPNSVKNKVCQQRLLNAAKTLCIVPSGYVGPQNSDYTFGIKRDLKMFIQDTFNWMEIGQMPWGYPFTWIFLNNNNNRKPAFLVQQGMKVPYPKHLRLYVLGILNHRYN